MPCVFRPCVACAIVALIGVPVSAEVFTWTGNESTDFIDPLNWISDGGGVPGAGDQCVAHASSATTAYIDVDSGQHITIDSFIMNRANLQLRLRIGASLTIDPATASDPGLIVGRDGHSARLVLDCFSTPAPSSLMAPTIILGDDFGSLGRLEFNRAGEFHITQDLIVGRLGHGDIAHNHQFGGMPTVNAQRLSVAVGVFSDSTLLINDATWTIDDSVRLGI